MCKPFEIAKTTVNEFIKKEEPFGFEEVQDKILTNGGVLRVAPGVTISDYLEVYEEKKIIFYNNFTDKYNFVAMIRKIRNERMATI